jgi:hypothetical protein
MQELAAVQLPTTSPPHGSTPHVPTVGPLLLGPHPAAANNNAAPATVAVPETPIFIGGTLARVAAKVNRFSCDFRHSLIG